MKIKNLAFASALITLLSGCATIAGDNTRSVKVDSYPAGARIYVDNQQ